MAWTDLKSTTADREVLPPFQSALLPSPARILLLLSFWKQIQFATPAQSKPFLFVWGFPVVFIVGREKDRAANTLLFGGDKPLYRGNCPSDRSLTKGWTLEAKRDAVDAEEVSSGFVRQVLKATTPDPSLRGKREFLSRGYADGISQGYLRKACLCDGALRPTSLKISFQLAKRNKTLPCGQLGLERREDGEAAVWIASRGGATACQTSLGSQGNGKDQLFIALTLSPDIYRPLVK